MSLAINAVSLLQWPRRYRNTDPVLVNYLIRLAAEKHGLDYFSLPWMNVFYKVGMRSVMIDTDPKGNMLLQGYEQACVRDWARLGNLYLQDGVVITSDFSPKATASMHAQSLQLGLLINVQSRVEDSSG